MCINWTNRGINTINPHVATTKITPSEYLILIAFPWKQWLGERTSMYILHCIDIASLVV